MCDYSCGMVCALARDKEHALGLVEARRDRDGSDFLSDRDMRELERTEPTIITESDAFWVYGGG